MLVNYRCNFLLTTQSDIDWNDPANTTSDSVKHNIRFFGQSCCSDGKSVLHVNKNICLNSSNYNGSATVTVYGGATGTCDSRIASSSFHNKNFPTLSCINDFDSGDVSSSGIAQELIRYFEPDCCTDKKSICWKDFSKLCKTPSNYNGDGMLGNYRCNYYFC